MSVQKIQEQIEGRISLSEMVMMVSYDGKELESLSISPNEFKI